MEHAEALDLIAAAALHALTGEEELAALEQHVRECDACEGELALARRAAAQLSLLRTTGRTTNRTPLV